jgi:hypothetical protein
MQLQQHNRAESMANPDNADTGDCDESTILSE